jgi:hypothetical protein
MFPVFFAPQSLSAEFLQEIRDVSYKGNALCRTAGIAQFCFKRYTFWVKRYTF